MLAMLDTHIGLAAGVLTSVLWTGTSLLFTAAGRRMGPTAVNGLRLTLACLLLGFTHRLLAGTWVPDVLTRQVVFLALSGIIGLSIGDQALFTAFVNIGPRLAMLIMATAPIFATLLGWAVLGETLPPMAWVGVALTMAGVGWVVLERPEEQAFARRAHRARGVILAFVAGACQAGGLLLSKQGMGHGWLPEDQHLSPQAATLVRMVCAALGFVPIALVHKWRRRRQTLAGNRPLRVGSWRVGLMLTAGGAVVGPFLGVWMSLVASDRAPLGIAQTLCSLSPVFILPCAVAVYKERISPRAILGAFIAVGGSALLFLYPR
ncbi:MAG: DMT family transporter [Planctomycetes bacterium]|nr:DMT family transporter [Planctomycetota bacterium]